MPGHPAAELWEGRSMSEMSSPLVPYGIFWILGGSTGFGAWKAWNWAKLVITNAFRRGVTGVFSP